MGEVLKAVSGLWPVVVLLIVAGVVVLVIKILFDKKPGEKEGQEERVYAYHVVESLLTPNELGFYHLLSRTVAGKYTLLTKVNVYDVLKASAESTSKDGSRLKVSQWHFDFVICEPKTMAPVAAVELDDSSHQGADRIKRDEFLSVACSGAGLKLIRYRSQRELAGADLLARLGVAGRNTQR